MKSLYTLIVLFLCTLTLSGCDPDLFVSQAPNIADCIGKTPDKIYRQAESALRNRKYNTAISSFRALIKLYPDHEKAEMAHLALIQCYGVRGQFKEALKEIEAFMRLYPNSPHNDSLKKKAEFLRRKEKMDRLYHFAWLQNIKDKNKTSYRSLVKRFDRLREVDKSLED